MAITRKFYPHLWIMAAYIPFVFFIKSFLPENIARENGIIENFQLVLLAAGAYLCFQAMRKTKSITNKYIWQAGTLFFILLFGREISWGRALFMYSDGSLPSWDKLGWYGQIIYSLIGFAIWRLLKLFYRGKIFSFLKSVQIPMWDLVFLFVFMILADTSEHYHFSIFNGEVDEELFECAMYFEMLKITSFIGKQ